MSAAMLAMTFIFAIWIGFNFRRDAVLDWNYQWLARKAAPVRFWSTNVLLAVLAIFGAWAAYLLNEWPKL